VKLRRRYVETARSTHCHIGRAEVEEQVGKAVRAAGDSSKVEVTRRGGCVTIRTLEQREVPDSVPLAAPTPSPSQPNDD
jgi:hypothetical protein